MTYLSPQVSARYPVPVPLVLEAIEGWLIENSHGWVPDGGSHNHGVLSPVGRLAACVGIPVSTCSRQLSRFRNESTMMSLALADTYLSGMGREDVWDLPELKGLRPASRGKAWMRSDERESPRTWARRVMLELGPGFREVAAALDIESLRDVDESRPARHVRLGARAA